jgi:hypothetical protein
MTRLYTRSGTVDLGLYRAASQLAHAAAAEAARIAPGARYGYLGDVQSLGHIARAALDWITLIADGQTDIDWDGVADALGVTRAEAEAILEAHRQH